MKREKKDFPALSVKDLTVRYGDHTAIAGINLEVPSGAYLAVIGPNGGGKSTLLKAILGLVPAAGGQVRIFGRPSGQAHGLVGYVPQFSEIDRRFPISVFEAVLTARTQKRLRPFYRYKPFDRQASEEVLWRVGLAGLADKPLTDLSGGEFQKVLLARALAARPRLLLLDEPTANVDATARQQIYQLLHELHAEMTIVMVTHDMLAVTSHVESLACLNHSLIYHGDPLLELDTVNELYGCPVDLIAHGVPHRVLPVHKEDG